MKMAMVMIGLMVASLTVIGSSAQQIATCGSKLVSCGPYLNSTSPPESCCRPLKDALTHDLACLCSIYSSPNLLKAFNIDLNSALQLPKHCGMPSFSTAIACVNNTAEAPGASINPPQGIYRTEDNDSDDVGEVEPMPATVEVEPSAKTTGLSLYEEEREVKIPDSPIMWSDAPESIIHFLNLKVVEIRHILPLPLVMVVIGVLNDGGDTPDNRLLNCEYPSLSMFWMMRWLGL